MRTSNREAPGRGVLAMDRHHARVVFAAIGSLLITASAVVPLVAMTVDRASAAPTIAGDKAQMAQLDQEYLADEANLHALSSKYDQEQTDYQAIVAKLNAAQAALVQAETNQAKTKDRLRQAAIDAYIGEGSDASSLGALFDSNENTYMVRTELDNVAGSVLSGLMDRYANEAHGITRMEKSLRVEKSHAQSVLVILNNDKVAAQAQANTAVALLNKVRSNLGELEKIRQEEIAAQQAAAAAAAAQLAAQRAAEAAQQAAQGPVSGSGGSGGAGGIYSGPPPVGFAAQAAVAVQAAMAQVGKAYVWGGANPSVGFDCSGLVMWAWAQAGVSLAHYSVAQYDSVPSISASQLQPGDIVFYYSSDGGGQPGHEALYIGGGQVVQAADQQYGILVTSIDWVGDPIAYGQP